MKLNDKIKICKVIAQAILADGQLTDSEHDFLEILMNKYELSEEQRKDVMARNIGESPAQLAKDLSGSESRNELMVEVAMAVAADGEFSSSERKMIYQVASALGINNSEMDMLVKTALM